MDENRRMVLYAQLRAILIELLWPKPTPKPVSDENVLRIHASEVVGTKEKMH